MKQRIAPELESLMWTLAEEGNERAIDEFGSRHPEMRTELVHRINMVKGLRSEKGVGTAPTASIPRFVPREPKTTPIQSRGPMVLVGGLVLAAIAAAAFTVTTFMAPEPRLHKEDLPAIRHNDPPKPQTTVEQTPTVIAPQATESDPVVKGLKSEAALKPTILRVDGSPLLTVLQMMAEITGTKIVSAPGMPNPNVEVNYQNMTAMDMLRDLGRKYAFTPIDQNDGSILVVPAVDKSGVGTGTGTGGGIRDQKIGG